MITQVTYERVYNLGSYESERISATVTVEDTTEAAYDEARAAVASEHARTVAAKMEITQIPNAPIYDPPASDKQLNFIATLQEKAGWTSDNLASYCSHRAIDLAKLTKAQASALIEHLQVQAKQEQIVSGWAANVVGPVQKKRTIPDDGEDIPF